MIRCRIWLEHKQALLFLISKLMYKNATTVLCCGVYRVQRQWTSAEYTHLFVFSVSHCSYLLSLGSTHFRGTSSAVYRIVASLGLHHSWDCHNLLANIFTMDLLPILWCWLHGACANNRQVKRVPEQTLFLENSWKIGAQGWSVHAAPTRGWNPPLKVFEFYTIAFVLAL